jgi:hypothetical protein
MKRPMSVLGIIGIVVVVAFLIYKLFTETIPNVHQDGIAGSVGGVIGGTIADLRVWLLVIGLWFLHRRNQKAASK